MPARLTLGLYNAYDPRRFFEAHRRALVRAAALALGFDAHLASFGFPFDDLAAHGGRTAESRGKRAPDKRGVAPEAVPLRTPQDVAALLARSTSVGGESAPLVELAQVGGFHAFGFPGKGFPPQLGRVVLTSEHAAGPRRVTPREVAAALEAGRGQLLVFGLGPHGTPPEVDARADAVLDVTLRNRGLETATAMGACIAAVRAHQPPWNG